MIGFCVVCVFYILIQYSAIVGWLAAVESSPWEFLFEWFLTVNCCECQANVEWLETFDDYTEVTVAAVVTAVLWYIFHVFCDDKAPVCRWQLPVLHGVMSEFSGASSAHGPECTEECPHARPHDKGWSAALTLSYETLSLSCITTTYSFPCQSK